MARMMKDSGIQWIGQIPEDWKVNRAAPYALEVDCPNVGNTETNALQFKMGKIISKSVGDSKYHPETLEAYNKVKNGDVIINGLNLVFDFISQRVGLVKEDGVITSAYIALRPTNISSEYITYLYKAYDICKVFHRMGKGLRATLTYDEIKRCLIIIPPLDEQTRIANFLDKKCSAIDSVLEKTKASIEEYKKLKQSVITQAVTKGIRPNRQMKDSGIEWIGKIPDDWNTKVVFQIFRQVKNKNTGMIEQNLMSLSYGKIKRKNIETTFGLLPESFEGYNIIEKDDIVLRLTDLQNDHTSLRTGISREKGIITSAYLTIRNYSDNSPEYLHYYLHAFDICKGFYGMGAGVRQGLNWEEMKKLKILVPPLAEQQAIADYLGAKCSEIDNLIAKKEQFVKEIENYKKSLIYEYVTGKKEVL